MKAAFLLVSFAASAWGAGARPAPSAPAAFSPAPARWVAVGKSLVDARAPGAPLLLRALEYKPEPQPLLGLFERRTGRVVNAFVMAENGVDGHSDALPPGADESALGGYVFALSPAGEPRFAGSGHFHNGVTPAVERSLLRHFGVLPREEGWLAGGLRRLLDFWDGLRRVFID